MEEIKRVHSHPQALAQCESNLRQLGVERIVEKDTAGSARLLLERGDRDAGALASRRAADVYQLEILRENMEDNPANLTRFLAISNQPNEGGLRDGVEYKTSIVFSLHNRPGALLKRSVSSPCGISTLLRSKSRPMQGKPWEYLFFIDIAGHPSERNAQRALDHLDELAPLLRVLGTYPRHQL